MLRVLVTVDGDSEKATFATVELMDAVGSSNEMNRKLTDNDGRVTFQTVSGVHRVRITAPTIETYEGELQIERNETSHLERIRVRHAAAAGDSRNSEQPPGGLVASVRLNIPAAARKAYQKGEEAMRKRRWEESRSLFETAVHEYPQFDLAYDHLGVVQIQLNETAAARQSFSRAIEINPDFAEAYRNLARISVSERKYQEADTLLVKSLSTEPLNVWALATSANAELILHNYNDAIGHARQAHSVAHPGLAGVHIVAGMALEATQQRAQALKEYQLYLDEDPNGRDAGRAMEAIARLGGTPAM
ncbi:MAG TPA: tetratricopeptide repeat protein [Candidatus Acidoferrum sp.]|jgi:tetratricopeptide (TPR) repeat protein